MNLPAIWRRPAVCALLCLAAMLMPTQPTAGAAAPETMVLVEGGIFRLERGNASAYDQPNPPHWVNIKSFYIGRYEVTFDEYDTFCREDVRVQPGDFSWPRGRYPVAGITWQDAADYCNWLSRKEGLTPAYSGEGDDTVCDFTADGYRLPTEVEWEYAARGGHSGGRHPYSGSDNPDEVAWYETNAGRQSHIVGSKRPNELGLYDMSGNVAEWCWDRYLRPSPVGPPERNLRSDRGGSAFTGTRLLRIDLPSPNDPWGRYRSVGFRVVRSCRPSDPAASTPLSAQRPAGTAIPPQMAAVMGGTFTMGNDADGADKDEQPVRPVTVRSFYMGRYEVTFAEFDAYCEAIGRRKFDDDGGGRGQNPASHISWQDAVDYCNWLSLLEGLHPAYSGFGDNTLCDFDADGYRLPTEAEWEYAARGGPNADGYLYSGSNDPDLVAWHRSIAGMKAHPVGEKQPNSLGLCDMTGNITEWCWDRYTASYRDASTDNPTGASPLRYSRVHRGGSWADEPRRSHVTTRSANRPEEGFSTFGFRLVRTMTE